MKLFRMFLVSLALGLIFAGAALAKADVTELYAEALMSRDSTSPVMRASAYTSWRASRKGSWSSTVSASATCAAPSWVT